MDNSSIGHTEVTEEPPSNGRRENYPSKRAKTLGVVQVIPGITCFVCQTAGMVSGDRYLMVMAAGLWGGVMMMVAGGLGISAAKKKTTCLIVSVMVMSILASVSSVIIIVYSALSLQLRDTSWNYDYDPDFSVTIKDCVVRRCPVYTKQPCTFTRDTQCEVRVAMCSILVLCGAAEFVVAIWASALCCAVTCCQSIPQERTQGVVYHGSASQFHQTTSTAIGNVQNATPGKVIVLQLPATIGNAALLNYTVATAQPEAVLINQPDPGQDLSDSQHYEELIYNR